LNIGKEGKVVYARGPTVPPEKRSVLRIMAKANDPPLKFGKIIDRIEQMREELLMLQRSLEKMELAEPAVSEDEASNGIKDV
jgi:hypothetical protein